MNTPRKLKYGLEDRPPLPETLSLGLQWFFVLLPGVVIIGNLVGRIEFTSLADQALSLRKIAFVCAVILLVQLFRGHRLPLIPGPSTILLVGILSSRGASFPAIYSAMILGGILLAVMGLTGLFGRVRRFFTPRVIAVVLLLIAFTLCPAILDLFTRGEGTASPFEGILFATGLTFAMILLYRLAGEAWRSHIILAGTLAGSLLYFLLFPGALRDAGAPGALVGPLFGNLLPGFSLDPGLLTAFFICYIALAINDLGSMESLNVLLDLPGGSRRINRGIAVTGIGNVFAGFLGVIGPVNYSMSPGMILSTGSAARVPLVLSGVLLLLLSFSPAVTGIAGRIPSPVIGAVLLYITGSQIVAGLLIVFESSHALDFEEGLIIGLPVLLGTMVAFAPPDVIQSLPPSLRSVLGNGFVIGMGTSLLLEHGILRRKGKHP
ncbi:MAG TPA: solute carrier family 23 protein [Syntrophales bacterium]|nr:solute carrier family 23 protein [Syntrophales bacterium]HQN77579.1 solute carrier family 23 protein [Syntrophales bacterium]HQQ26535.1 solute carrier family 23 protein [Syntrophales bacterium]